MAQNKFKTYEISCGKCNEYLLSYKKFGAGKGILRLYLAHIAAPENLVDFQDDYELIKEVPNLQCSNCEEILGTPNLSKSGRWVYKMKQGYFHRKLKK